jgi:hypothetical protein
MVHQLVTSLSGSIDVRSEQDVGTQIDIFIPIDEVTGTSTLPAAMPTPTRPTRFCLVGFNARPDRADPPTGMMSRESKRKLSIQSFFTHLMAIHSTWTVCFAETVDKATGDVIILEESILKHASIREAAATFSRMVLLGGASASTATTNLSAQVQVYHIPQP